VRSPRARARDARAYLCIGLGGLLLFGENKVPQDLLQGFDGRVGGSLAAFFCVCKSGRPLDDLTPPVTISSLSAEMRKPRAR